ncbi:MAG: winged helix-turn-helix domain-containing protein [Nitrosopumilus sp.]
MLINKKTIMFLLATRTAPDGTQTKTCDRNSKGTNLRPILYTHLMNKTSLDRGLFAHYLKMLKQNGLIKENYNKVNQEKYGYTLTAKAVELLDRIEKTILAYKQISKSKEQLETYNT